MTMFKKLMLVFTMLGAGAAVQASDDSFAGLRTGQGSEKLKRSSSLGIRATQLEGVTAQDAPWGAHLGSPRPLSGYAAGYGVAMTAYNGIKLRQENPTGSYDVRLTATASTQWQAGGLVTQASMHYT